MRTVQRWEREEQLPVHRLHHEKLGSLYAYKSELDAWWAGRGAGLKGEALRAPQDEPSIAVLPFSDLSREKDQDYFCEGIAEEISTALSRIAGLRVGSRTAALRFKASDLDIAEVARRLHVNTLLEGSVRKAGERLRIAVQLSDTATGYQLWSEMYDRPASDIFGIQEDIARSVAQALRLNLSAHESDALRRPAAHDAAAYDYYLRGRSFYYRYGPRDMECAIQLFMGAIQCDPAYARAFAGLADCWSFLYLYSQRNEALSELALWAGGRAVELDPACGQAQASRALALSLCRRDEEAEKAFEEAIRLEPALFEAYYFYARHAFARGQPDRALHLYEQAIRVRPEDYQASLLMAQIYDDRQRPEEAAAARLRGIQNAEEHLKRNPDDARAIYMAANGMAGLGRKDQAREWAGRARAMRPDDSMLLYNVGCIYSLAGSVDDALAALESAVALGLTEKGWFEHDSNLDSLRGHPRFKKLVRSLK